MLDIVVSTIGPEFLSESIESLLGAGYNGTTEVIAVVDQVGRLAAHLSGPVICSDDRVRIAYSEPGPHGWAVMNGCYNTGLRLTSAPYVLFTHDDVMYPSYNLWGHVTHILRQLEQLEWYYDKPLAGVVLPTWEVAANVPWPPATNLMGLTQVVGPVSTIVRREFLDSIGGFDELHGIWYDGQLQEELAQRAQWLFVAPTLHLVHESNRTYRRNDWGNRWAANPKWGHYQENFKRRYGKEPPDRTNTFIPINDSRFLCACAAL